MIVHNFTHMIHLLHNPVKPFTVRRMRFLISETNIYEKRAMANLNAER